PATFIFNVMRENALRLANDVIQDWRGRLPEWRQDCSQVVFASYDLGKAFPISVNHPLIMMHLRSMQLMIDIELRQIARISGVRSSNEARVAARNRIGNLIDNGVAAML